MKPGMCSNYLGNRCVPVCAYLCQIRTDTRLELLYIGNQYMLTWPVAYGWFKSP